MRRLLAPLLLLAAAPAPQDERAYMFTGFDRLRVDGPFTVDVETGSPGATATGDPRALDRLSLRVEGGTLVVNTGTTGWELRAGESAAGTKIRIRTTSLRSVLVNGGANVHIAEMRVPRVDIALNGGGAIHVDRVQADDTNVSLIGTGAITLGGATLKGRVRAHGAGSVDASALTANEATLISETSGEVRMKVRYTARVMALGAGLVGVTGQPECTVSGPGPVECEGKVIRR